MDIRSNIVVLVKYTNGKDRSVYSERNLNKVCGLSEIDELQLMAKVDKKILDKKKKDNIKFVSATNEVTFINSDKQPYFKRVEFDTEDFDSLHGQIKKFIGDEVALTNKIRKGESYDH